MFGCCPPLPKRQVSGKSYFDVVRQLEDQKQPPRRLDRLMPGWPGCGNAQSHRGRADVSELHAAVSMIPAVRRIPPRRVARVKGESYRRLPDARSWPRCGEPVSRDCPRFGVAHLGNLNRPPPGELRWGLTRAARSGQSGANDPHWHDQLPHRSTAHQMTTNGLSNPAPPVSPSP